MGLVLMAGAMLSKSLIQFSVEGWGCVPSLLFESESDVTQSCLTLWDPKDCSLPCSSIHGIFQARVLEWLPFPSPGDLPDQGIEPQSLTL